MTKHSCRRFTLLFFLAALPVVSEAAVSLETSSVDAASGFFASPLFEPRRPAGFLPTPVGAGSPAETKAAGSGHYLIISEIDFSAIPEPPPPGSAKEKGDLKTLLAWQASRTSADCARARAEVEHSYKVFFGKITPFVFPEPGEVTRFFKNVGEDAVAAYRHVKNIHKRPRPFLRDPGITPCVMKPGGYSYPSGHAAISRVFALILGDLVPSRRAEFLARADEAALNRVIGGIHYPTDSEAGGILANELYRDLSGKPDFITGRESLRGYLR